jgi:prepilin-type N-terminal cleavage/methylation domain-containing protein
MRTPDRRGFSLIELLIALVMLGLFAGAFYNVLIAVQRTSGRQTHQANMQGNLRAGIQLVQTELQDLRTDGVNDTDILSMSGSAIRYRVMRGVGEACSHSNSGVEIRQSTFSGPHAPNPSFDSLAIYVDGDSTRTDDDTWMLTPFTGGGASTCPDGEAAWTASVNLTAQDGSIYSPSPIRTYEEMELGLVTSGGKDWLGIRAINKSENTLIPVIGPLATGGVAFEYFDINNTALTGNTQATRSDVRTITITLTGITDQTVHTGVGSAVSNPTDVITIRIQLRNAL